jgi:UDP-glucose 6-dehydrogenase
MNKIAIIGLGYVGLPLARLFATKYPVVGFEPDIQICGFVFSPIYKSIPELVSADVPPNVNCLFTLNGVTIKSDVVNGLNILIHS